jgi:hypothetical protein
MSLKELRVMVNIEVGDYIRYHSKDGNKFGAATVQAVRTDATGAAVLDCGFGLLAPASWVLSVEKKQTPNELLNSLTLSENSFKQATASTLERVTKYLAAKPGMIYWGTSGLTDEERRDAMKGLKEEYVEPPTKSFSALVASAMAGSFRDTPWALKQAEEERLADIENTAWQLFCTEPAVREFCLRVSEGRDHEPVLEKMWERDENGWKTAAMERATLMEVF